MKKILITLFLILFSGSFAFADELHFNDGTVIKVTIITVTPTTIEYSVVGGKPFNVAQRSQLSKLIYSDGTSVSLKVNDSPAVSSSEPSAPSESKSSMVPIQSDNGRQPIFSRMTLEIECGWNGYVGAGSRIDYRLFDSFAVNGGAGIGAWGIRLGGGMRYYFTYPFGAAFGLGIAWNSGSTQKQSFETESTSGMLVKEDVSIKCKPVAVVNATFLYSFELRSGSKVYIETGWGFSLQKDPYTYTSPSGNKFSHNSKQTMKYIQPGGFILSAGLAFF